MQGKILCMMSPFHIFTSYTYFLSHTVTCYVYFYLTYSFSIFEMIRCEKIIHRIITFDEQCSLKKAGCRKVLTQGQLSHSVTLKVGGSASHDLGLPPAGEEKENHMGKGKGVRLRFHLSDLTAGENPLPMKYTEVPCSVAVGMCNLE